MRSLIPASLRYVDQVARSGSIQAAAKELRVAASAINRQILRLEEEMGVPLFDRYARGMRLTVSGETLVTLIRQWRSDERRAAAEIQRLQGRHQGHVRLMAMDSHSTSFLPGFVESMVQAHPRVSLSIDLVNTDEAATTLLAGEADLAVVFNLAPRREFLVLWRAELPLGCVIAPNHPLSKADTVSLQEAASHPIVLQSKALTIRRFLEAQYAWLFAEDSGRIETNSLQLVKRLVRSGRYVAFTSELDVAPELAEGTLKFLPVRDKSAQPQTVSIAINASKPLAPLVKIVAERLEYSIAQCLHSIRDARSR